MNEVLCTEQPSSERDLHHRGEAGSARCDRTEPVEQALEYALLRVMIAVAEAAAAGVSPDLGRHEQKAQAGRGQPRVRGSPNGLLRLRLPWDARACISQVALSRVRVRNCAFRINALAR